MDGGQGGFAPGALTSWRLWGGGWKGCAWGLGPGAWAPARQNVSPGRSVLYSVLKYLRYELPKGTRAAGNQCKDATA